MVLPSTTVKVGGFLPTPHTEATKKRPSAALYEEDSEHEVPLDTSDEDASDYAEPVVPRSTRKRSRRELTPTPAPAPSAPTPSPESGPIFGSGSASIDTTPAPFNRNGAYDRSFPYGHETIWTSGENHLCGLRAVIGSIQVQHPNMRVPKIDELQGMLETDAVKEGIKIIEMAGDGDDTDRNFNVSQLGLILLEWTRACDLPAMNLAVWQDGMEPIFVDAPDSTADTPIVWIHHNGSVSSGHYSGMRPLTLANAGLPVAPTPAHAQLAPLNDEADLHDDDHDDHEGHEGRRRVNGFLEPDSSAGAIERAQRKLEEVKLQDWLGIPAEMMGILMAEAGNLCPRLPATYRPNKKFVAVIKKHIARIRQGAEDVMSSAARLALQSASDEEWARAIDYHTTEVVKTWILDGKPPKAKDFKKLPNALESIEFGVYICMLLALDNAHHNHLYVGSGTGTSGPTRYGLGGIQTRVMDRDLPKLPPSYFHALLRDGEPREPVWGVIWEIEGSQEEQDAEVRTSNRFLSYLAERLFHDLLCSWSELQDRLSAWRDPVDWLGVNCGDGPLKETNACKGAFSRDLKQLRLAQRNRERWKRKTSEEKEMLNEKRRRPGTKPRGKEWKWTQDEDRLILQLRQVQGLPFPEAHQIFSKVHPGRSVRGLRGRVGKLLKKLDGQMQEEHIEPRPWTAEEEDLLIRLTVELRSWPEIHRRFCSEFPPRSIDSLQKHHRALLSKRDNLLEECEASGYTAYVHAWLPEHESTLSELWGSQPIQEIVRLFAEKFPNAARTEGAIKERATHLGLKKRRAPNFTPQEDAFLREIMEDPFITFRAAAEVFSGRFPPRSREQIKIRWRYLNISRA